MRDITSVKADAEYVSECLQSISLMYKELGIDTSSSLPENSVETFDTAIEKLLDYIERLSVSISAYNAGALQPCATGHRQKVQFTMRVTIKQMQAMLQYLAEHAVFFSIDHLILKRDDEVFLATMSLWYSAIESSDFARC